MARTQRLEVFASVLVQSLPSPPRRRAYFSAIASRSLATRLPTMSRNLPKGAPLPKAPFAAGVAIMGGMFYAVLLDAKGRQPDIPAAEQGSANTLSADADTSSSSTANRAGRFLVRCEVRDTVVCSLPPAAPAAVSSPSPSSPTSSVCVARRAPPSKSSIIEGGKMCSAGSHVFSPDGKPCYLTSCRRAMPSPLTPTRASIT